MSTPEGIAFLERNRSALSLVYMVQQSTQVKGIHTIIRDRQCTRAEFIFQSDRLIRFTVEEAVRCDGCWPGSCSS